MRFASKPGRRHNGMGYYWHSAPRLVRGAIQKRGIRPGRDGFVYLFTTREGADSWDHPDGDVWVVRLDEIVEGDPHPNASSDMVRVRRSFGPDEVELEPPVRMNSDTRLRKLELQARKERGLDDVHNYVVALGRSGVNAVDDEGARDLVREALPIGMASDFDAEKIISLFRSSGALNAFMDADLRAGDVVIAGAFVHALVTTRKVRLGNLMQAEVISRPYGPGSGESPVFGEPAWSIYAQNSRDRLGTTMLHRVAVDALRRLSTRTSPLEEIESDRRVLERRGDLRGWVMTGVGNNIDFESVACPASQKLLEDYHDAIRTGGHRGRGAVSYDRFDVQIGVALRAFSGIIDEEEEEREVIHWSIRAGVGRRKPRVSSGRALMVTFWFDKLMYMQILGGASQDPQQCFPGSEGVFGDAVEAMEAEEHQPIAMWPLVEREVVAHLMGGDWTLMSFVSADS